MWRTWRVAMADSLYGPDGFYRQPSAPRSHFRTAAHVSPLWAQCWYELAGRVAAQIPGGFTIVEIGAGGGELLAGLATLAPAEWRLVGLEVAPRPPDLPSRVEWLDEPPPSFAGLAIAVEWLDVVPLDVVVRDDDGRWRLVQVDGEGNERLGDPPTSDDLGWLDRWCPPDVERAEIGHSRDGAWRGFAERLTRGLAVAVDYGVGAERDTLTGYRSGRQTRPIPDGRHDVTAHVFFDSLQRPTMTQRDALSRLGLRAQTPAYSGDPRTHLDALAATSQAAELLDPYGLGGFTWLVESKGIALQDCFA